MAGEPRPLGDALREVVEELAARELRFCLFGGAAVRAYAPERPLHEVDVLVRTKAVEELAAAFPRGRRIRAEGVAVGPVEVWREPLPLAWNGGLVRMSFDELAARLVEAEVDGVRVPVLAPEDVLVTKAITQRGPEVGKCDLDDVVAVLRSTAGSLDLDYLRARARACGALPRVRACLARFGAVI